MSWLVVIQILQEKETKLRSESKAKEWNRLPTYAVPFITVQRVIHLFILRHLLVVSLSLPLTANSSLTFTTAAFATATLRFCLWHFD